jgi:bis(5'-nucleosyl)-tetraphosphatase (symmetrical)
MSTAARRRPAKRTRRRIFVGDIQGCLSELRRLLELLRFDPATDELHPVGDFVNRGPDSAGVLRLLRDLDAGGVLGNHDLHLLRAARDEEPLKRSDTIADVLDAPDRDELLGWLAARPFVRSWPDLLLVHAGLHPRWRDPERRLRGVDPWRPNADARIATQVRWCTARGARPAREDVDPGPPFEPWFAFYPGPRVKRRTVVFGHWAARGLVHAPLLRGLDTGCVWGGRLTAWIAEEDRFVAVSASKAYAKPRR